MSDYPGDERDALNVAIAHVASELREARRHLDEARGEIECANVEERRLLDDNMSLRRELDTLRTGFGASMEAFRNHVANVERERDEARGDAARLLALLREVGGIIDEFDAADDSTEELRIIHKLGAWAERAITATPAAPALGAVLDPGCVKCIKCRECAGACDCTGGPQTEQECTCYELTGGHQPGCYYNRPRALATPTPSPGGEAGQGAGDRAHSGGGDGIRARQKNQPWTVPYSDGVMRASEGDVRHILASHCTLHAAKTVGKLAAVFEAMDHRNIAVPTFEQLQAVKDMSADLFVEALRFANLFGFDLADEHTRRVVEKNGTNTVTTPPAPKPAPIPTGMEPGHVEYDSCGYPHKKR